MVFVLQLNALGGGGFMREVTKQEGMLGKCACRAKAWAASLFLLHAPCPSFQAVKAGGAGWELLHRLARTWDDSFYHGPHTGGATTLLWVPSSLLLPTLGHHCSL